MGRQMKAANADLLSDTSAAAVAAKCGTESVISADSDDVDEWSCRHRRLVSFHRLVARCERLICSKHHIVLARKNRALDIT